MSRQFEISEACVEPRLPSNDREEILRYLTGLLARQGYVDPAYAEKILEREASCPTGLSFPGMTIALPHGDPSYVSQASVAVGRCSGPTTFYSMEDPDQPLEVDMVVLLAVKDPDDHLVVLNNLMGMFTQPQICEELRSAQSREQICDIFRRMLY